MADEIMEELWEVKDELSLKCKQMGWQKYCEYLNQTVSTNGFRLLNRSRSKMMQVAEESAEYNVQSKT